MNHVKIWRILKESLKGFVADRCSLHASSLTFYTLLSIVPILAVAFGLAKGFGFEQNLEQQLLTKLSEHKETVSIVLNFARSLLIQAEGSYITGFGVAFLFLFVISLFWTIEASMNVIWKVKRARPLIRIFTDYLAMMLIFPFLFVIANSLIVFVITQIGVAVEQHQILKSISPLLYFGYRGITLIVIWTLFSSIYLIMPYTKVLLRHAFLGAVIAGTLYYAVLVAMINFQIGVSQYNAIYGSFAALPLFLFWLQNSWLLVLFGAEISYHAGHLSPVLQSQDKPTTITFQTLLILVCTKILSDFDEGKTPLTLRKLSEHFAVTETCIKEILGPLIKQGILHEYWSDNNQLSYMPARNNSSVTLLTLIEASNPAADREVIVNRSPELEAIVNQIKLFQADSRSLKTNLSIHELLKTQLSRSSTKGDIHANQ